MAFEVSYHKGYLFIESPDTDRLRTFPPKMGGINIRPGLWVFPACRGHDILWEYLAAFPKADCYDASGSVCIQVPVDVEPSDSVYYVAGLCVARRAEHDAPVELGPGVQVLTGGFAPVGGTAGRPVLAAHEGTVLAICRVYALAAGRLGLEGACEIVHFRGDDAGIVTILQNDAEGCVSLWRERRVPGRLFESHAHGPHRCVPDFHEHEENDDWEGDQN